jgi:hypothetical protein
MVGRYWDHRPQVIGTVNIAHYGTVPQTNLG